MLLNCGVGEDSWESPDCKEIQPVHHKGDQSWVFIGRTDVEAQTPVLWPPHAKSWLIGKDSDAGRDWEQEEKVATEDEMAGWHHGLDGRESEWTPGDGDHQGSLACCDSWGRKESDMTERLNWTELKEIKVLKIQPYYCVVALSESLNFSICWFFIFLYFVFYFLYKFERLFSHWQLLQNNFILLVSLSFIWEY